MCGFYLQGRDLQINILWGILLFGTVIIITKRQDFRDVAVIVYNSRYGNRVEGVVYLADFKNDRPRLLRDIYPWERRAALSVHRQE